MRELETAVMQLQSSLHQHLFDNASIKQQQTIVRQLIELGASGDPTWDALRTSFTTMRSRNVNLLKTAKKKWESDSVNERREITTNFIEGIITQFRGMSSSYES